MTAAEHPPATSTATAALSRIENLVTNHWLVAGAEQQLLRDCLAVVVQSFAATEQVADEFLPPTGPKRSRRPPTKKLTPAPRIELVEDDDDVFDENWDEDPVNSFAQELQALIQKTTQPYSTADLEAAQNDFQWLLQYLGHRLLEPHEELAFGYRIQAGIQAGKQLAKAAEPDAAALTDALRQQLELTVVDGKAALADLMNHNLRLVVSIAKRYLLRGLTLNELFDEGYFGLEKACLKFDPDRKHRFSTYATWWIRQTISRAVAQKGRRIRIPVHMSDRYKHWQAVKLDLEQELGRLPTVEEIGAEMKLRHKTSDHHIKVLAQIDNNQISVSLDFELEEGEGDELGDLIEDQSTISPAKAGEQAAARQILMAAINGLLDDDRQLIKMRRGFPPFDHEYTLEEIGQMFNVTREAIRRREARAHRRLVAYFTRHGISARDLMEALADDGENRFGLDEPAPEVPPVIAPPEIVNDDEDGDDDDDDDWIG